MRIGIKPHILPVAFLTIRASFRDALHQSLGWILLRQRSAETDYPPKSGALVSCYKDALLFGKYEGSIESIFR